MKNFTGALVGPSLGRGAALAVAVGLTLAAPRSLAGHDPDREVVIEWNQLLQDSIPLTVTLPSLRYYSMLHVAMFDAVNSVERDYSAYHVRVQASQGASAEAAAAQAAHDVLLVLFPVNQKTFDDALEARLEGIEPGRARQGVRVGRAVARAILEWRHNDGWEVPPPPYVLPALPGLWQPTPPAFAPAAGTQFPDVEPFALLSSTQFLPSRFPELSSEHYAMAFDEVKAIGSATSSIRTAEQTQLAHLFANVTSRTSAFAVWNNVARDTSRTQRLSLAQTARLFALMNVSINDGVQTSQTSKFVYALWRPVTAIRRADEDMNPLTAAEPSWTPLLTTPPYPSYAGNMACIGASAARALALNYGTDGVAFSVLWQGNTGNPDVTRKYAGFWQLADDQARSRVYGGIHFTFDNLASQENCSKVAEYVFENFAAPRK